MIIRNKGYFLAKLLRKTLRNRSKGLALVRAILYFSKVRAQNYLSAVSDQLLDGRKCCYDTCLICDHAIFERNVKIASYKDAFSFCINVINCFLVKHWYFLLMLSISQKEEVRSNQTGPLFRSYLKLIMQALRST